MKGETLPKYQIIEIVVTTSIYLPLDVQIGPYLIHFIKGNFIPFKFKYNLNLA